MPMNYSNPYLNMLPTVQQALAQINPLQQQQANAVNNIINPVPQQNMMEQQNISGNSPYVTKEEFNQLLEENKKLKEQLEKELNQRSDMEFFKKEQEVLKLDQGRRAFQEVEFSKQKYYDTLWRTSPIGKETMGKYRDTIESIYSRYAQQQPQQPASPVVLEKPKAEEQSKKYNVVESKEA